MIDFNMELTTLPKYSEVKWTIQLHQPYCRLKSWHQFSMLVSFYCEILQRNHLHFKILNDSAFQKFLLLLCDFILSKVNGSFVPWTFICPAQFLHFQKRLCKVRQMLIKFLGRFNSQDFKVVRGFAIAMPDKKKLQF